MSATPPLVNSSYKGLTEEEAKKRLQVHGYNELPRPNRRTTFRILLEVMREPMLMLVLAAGLIYLALGDLGEALILIVFGALSVTITIVQETRTEHVLEALRDLTSPRATVVRGGERRVVAGREVVTGDLVVLFEGDRVPADCLLLEVQQLEADESLLTGEAIPVRKVASTGQPVALTRPGGDDHPFVYSGSMIVRGNGLAEVLATGIRSQIGMIGQTLNALEMEPPRLQAETSRLVRLSALGAAVVSILTVVLYGTMRGGWLDALLAGIAIGMSMLPEEFPVVLTVFMAMGAWRISKANVLTRRAASIETLGAATVLCTDKTGTLTENRMTVTELRLPTGEVFSADLARDDSSLSEGFSDLAVAAAMASTPEPFDPMEKAFFAFLESEWAGRAPTTEHSLLKTYGLQKDLLAMTQVWQTKDATCFAVAKGAPETIADLCQLAVPAREELRASIAAMAEGGLRVLGVAKALVNSENLPDSQRAFPFEFLGLVGLADPLRQNVPAAVAECYAAGIRVVMITGDYPLTARAIAEQAGIEVGLILTGDDLSALSDLELQQQARTANVFARIMPEQKLRIVQALKADGEIVAMTGDGVNDAPSLKAAHIGVAMGARGTDVAREASTLVLLNDDFGSIVNAVRLGRRIYDNLRKAMGFIVAVHVPIAGLALLPLLLGLPIIFWPIHIAFLEMIIDPVCSLVFEAEVEESNVMRRPPRRPDAALFSWKLVGWSLLQGTVAWAMVAIVYVVTLNQGMPENEARALAFFTLVLSIIALILVNRSFSTSLLRAISRPNPTLMWVLTAVAAILALSLLWPFASTLFHFGSLHADDLLSTAVFFIATLTILELAKYLLGRRLEL